MARTAYNKITFTPAQRKFLTDNWPNMTNVQLAESLGLKVTRVRMELYAMGLKRMEQEKIPSQAVEYIKEHYRTMGDTEIAQELQQRWPKNKGWSKKHVEKKRRYLKLKRTKAQIQAIHTRNVALGMFADCPVKAWETRGGATPVGTIKIWCSHGRRFQVIKLKAGFVHYWPWLWRKHFGPVPDDMVVRSRASPDVIAKPSDLYVMTRAELAAENREAHLALPPELKETIKTINKLKKTLKNARK